MNNEKLIKIVGICLFSLIVIACITIPFFAPPSASKAVSEVSSMSEYDKDVVKAKESELLPAQKDALNSLTASLSTPTPKPVATPSPSPTPVTTPTPTTTSTPVPDPVIVTRAAEVDEEYPEATQRPPEEPTEDETVHTDEITPPEETPQEDPVEDEECTVPDYSYSGSDVDLLARAIFAETGCSWFPEWVRQYTGSVILNRVNSEIYPSTIYDVLYQDGQYTCVYDDLFYQSPPDYCVATAEYLLSNGSVLPSGVIGQSGEPLGEIYAVFSDPEGVCIDTYYFY